MASAPGISIPVGLQFNGLNQQVGQINKILQSMGDSWQGSSVSGAFESVTLEAMKAASVIKGNFTPNLLELPILFNKIAQNSDNSFLRLAGAVAVSTVSLQGLWGTGLLDVLKTTADLIPQSSALGETMQSIIMPLDIQHNIKKVAGAFSDLKIQVSGVAQVANNLATGLVQNVGNMMSGAAGAAGAPISLLSPTGAGGQNAIQAAFDPDQGIQTFTQFEEGAVFFKSLAEGAGASSAEVNRVMSEVKNLGASTSKSAVEVAVLARDMTRLGFNATDLADSIGGVVKTAEASGDPLILVGGIISDTLTNFGLAASEAGKVGDLLAAIANVSPTSITEIGEAVKYAGAAANAANQEVSETVVQFGLLAKAGLRGSMAGTSMVQVYSSLQSAAAGAATKAEMLGETVRLTSAELELLASGEAADVGVDLSGVSRGMGIRAKALAQLGLSREDLVDSRGELRAITDIIPALQKGVAELKTTAEGTSSVPVLLKSLFGDQGGRAMLALLNATEEDIRSLQDQAASSEGFSVGVSEKVLSGISGSFKKLASAVEGIAIAVGETFAPAVKFVADVLTNIFSTFLSLPGAVQKVIIAGSAVAPIVVALGSLYFKSVGLARVLQGSLGKGIGVVTGLFDSQKRAIILNNVALGVAEARAMLVAQAQSIQAAVTGLLTGKVKAHAVAESVAAKASLWYTTVLNLGFASQIKTIKFIGTMTHALLKQIIALTNINVVTAVNTAFIYARAAALKVVSGVSFLYTLALKATTAATTTSNASFSISTALVKSLTVAKGALAIATGTVAAANMTLAQSILVVASRMFVVVAALWVLYKAWQIFTAGMKEAKEIRKTNKQLEDLGNSTEETADKTKKSKGVIQGFFDMLGEAGGAMKYARTTKAISETVDITNKSIDASRKLIQDYGLAQVDAGDSARLGASGIAEFEKKAIEQKRILAESIEVLKKQNPENEAQREALKNQIALMTQSISLLDSRVNALNSEGSALKGVGEEANIVVTSYDDLTKKYGEIAKAQEMALLKEQGDLKQALSENALSREEYAAESARITKDSIDSEIAANEAAIAELQKAKLWMNAEDKASVEEELAERTKRAAELRIEALDAELDERKRINDELISAEEQKQSEIEALADIESNRKIAKIKGKQASGKISESEAEQQIGEVERRGTKDAIDEQKRRIREIRKLANKGALDETEARNKTLEAEREISSLKLDLIDQEIEERKRANEKIIADFEKRLEKEKATIEKTATASNLGIAQQQLSGDITSEDAEKAKAEVEKKALQDSLALMEREKAEIISLQARKVLSAEEAEQKISDIEKELLDTKLDLVNKEIEIREKAKEARIAQIEEEKKAAEAAMQAEIDAIAISLKQQQLAGSIDESDVAEATRSAAIDAAKARMDIEQANLDNIQKLRSEGVLSEEEANSRILDSEKALRDAELKLLDEKLAAQKAAKDERIAQIEEEANAVRASLKAEADLALIAAKQQQLSGSASESDVAKIARESAINGAKQEVLLRKQAIEKIKQLQQEGVLSEKDANEKILEAEKELRAAQISLLDEQLSQEKQNIQEALAEFEKAEKEKAAAMEKAASEAELTLRKQQLAGVRSAEDTNKMIQDIATQRTKDEIAAIEAQIAATQQLAAQGILSKEAAAEKIAELEQNLTNKNLDLIDKEIQAKKQAEEEKLKAVEDRLDKELEETRLALEQSSNLLDLQGRSIGLGNDQYKAQQGVLEALNTLDSQRLQHEIDRAAAAGKAGEAEKLKQALFIQQVEAQKQSQEFAQAQLAISQQQKAIDLERERIAAEIALAESQAEVAKAKASGASQAEIDALLQVQAFREQALGLTESAISAQETINQAQRDQLNIEQQIEREKALQTRQLELENELLKDKEDSTKGVRSEIKKSLEETKRLNAESEKIGLDTNKLREQYKGAQAASSVASIPNGFRAPGGGRNPAQQQPQGKPSVGGDVIGAQEININYHGSTPMSPQDIESAVNKGLDKVWEQVGVNLK